MKPIKVFFMGKRLKDIYPHATRWQVLKFRFRMFMRRVMFAGFAVCALYLAVLAGSEFFPQTTYAVQEKMIEVRKDSPVMERIAKCESHLKHIADNGQVTVNANSNGSVDIGKYQINMKVWGAKATELGYNLATEEGNKDMAYWIYETHGTEPWYSSKNCWK